MNSIFNSYSGEATELLCNLLITRTMNFDSFAFLTSYLFRMLITRKWKGGLQPPSITVSLYCTWEVWDCQNRNAWFGKRNLSTKFSILTHRTGKSAFLLMQLVHAEEQVGLSTYCAPLTAPWHCSESTKEELLPLSAGKSPWPQQSCGCRTVWAHPWVPYKCWRNSSWKMFRLYMAHHRCFPMEG